MTDGNVFTWKSFPTWKRMVAQAIPPNIHPSLTDTIQNRQSEFDYPDDVAPFEELYADCGDYEALIDRFVDVFYSSYEFVRMYHCCRPLNTDSYYKCGIRVLNMKFANCMFRDAILENPRFPTVTAEHLEAAFLEKRDSYRRNGYAYFGLDDRYLLAHCRQYLQKGSEYAQSLAALVDGKAGTGISAYLKDSGTPTVFETNIPIRSFGGAAIRDLGPSALYAWAYDIAHDTGEAFEIDFAVELDHDLLPEFIVGHYNASDGIGS